MAYNYRSLAAKREALKTHSATRLRARRRWASHLRCIILHRRRIVFTVQSICPYRCCNALSVCTEILWYPQRFCASISWYLESRFSCVLLDSCMHFDDTLSVVQGLYRVSVTPRRSSLKGGGRCRPLRLQLNASSIFMGLWLHVWLWIIRDRLVGVYSCRWNLGSPLGAKTQGGVSDCHHEVREATYEGVSPTTWRYFIAIEQLINLLSLILII